MQPKRIEILGVPVDCVNMKQAVEAVDAFIQTGRRASIIAINPEKIIAAHKSPVLMEAIQNAGLLIPDGVGVVLAARVLGLARLERVPGAELMPAICAAAARKHYRIFMFGASREVNLKASEVLRERYPGIQIVGNHHGYVSETDSEHLIDDINEANADLLFVALGSPRQERWINACLPKLNVKVCQGVGGTFDVIAGNVNRAPSAFRKANLEWFYRLGHPAQTPLAPNRPDPFRHVRFARKTIRRVTRFADENGRRSAVIVGKWVGAAWFWARPMVVVAISGCCAVEDRGGRRRFLRQRRGALPLGPTRPRLHPSSH